ncbi:MAG: hypothetical protein B6244_04330 [Candidatus Cloacimonetes bacterium 4572_55]|nr:MAG: hypothetical protein B6244_04330 [Candidatus Cloacimonetes bacterium 4572_55]
MIAPNAEPRRLQSGLHSLESMIHFLTGELDQVNDSNFAQKMDSLYLFADELIRQTTDAATKLYGNPPLCGAGCGHCCCQALIVSYAEAYHIFCRLNRFSLLPNILKKSRERVRLLREKFQIFPVHMQIDEHQRRYQSHIEKQNRLQLPCIFLLDNRRCMIYEYRPLTCRDAHVYEGDPVGCGTRRNPVVIALPLRPVYRLLAQGLSQKMCKETGGGDLPSILLGFDMRPSGDHLIPSLSKEI